MPLTHEEANSIYSVLRPELSKLSIREIRDTASAAGIDATRIPASSEVRSGLGSRAEVLPAIDTLFSQLDIHRKELAIATMAERISLRSTDLRDSVHRALSSHGFRLYGMAVVRDRSIGMPSLFLCHSSRDKFFVRELAGRLSALGVRVWLDDAEINIGDSLTDRIGRAITDMKYFGVVLSRHSIESEWVQRELQIAIQREFTERKVVVLPILLEPVEIPAFLRDKLYADFTTPERFDETFPRLLKALGVESGAEVRPERADTEAAPVVAQTPAERRLAEFEDIRIRDLDENASYNPDPKRSLYNMYLTLSSRPPTDWQEIFDAERRFPRHNMWRRAWIEGQSIVVYCVPEELEQYHSRDLLQDVDNANKKYREYLTELAQREAKERSQLRDQRERMRAIKRRLGYE